MIKMWFTCECTNFDDTSENKAGKYFHSYLETLSPWFGVTHNMHESNWWSRAQVHWKTLPRDEKSLEKMLNEKVFFLFAQIFPKLEDFCKLSKHEKIFSLLSPRFKLASSDSTFFLSRYVYRKGFMSKA